MSFGPAIETSARTSSLAGLIVLKASPSIGSTNSPPMKSPYDGRRSTMARDSGAGEYSQLIGECRSAGRGDRSLDAEVIRTHVRTGELLCPLHEKVVEQRRRAEAEMRRVQPFVTDRLVHEDEVSDRVLGGPDR